MLVNEDQLLALFGAAALIRWQDVTVINIDTFA
jgi:hypothetical protein